MAREHCWACEWTHGHAPWCQFKTDAGGRPLTEENQRLRAALTQILDLRPISGGTHWNDCPHAQCTAYRALNPPKGNGG